MATRATHQTRYGFTLFEVAIALGISAVGVLSLLILLPQGIKAQEQARYRLYAATAGLDIIESFSSKPIIWPTSYKYGAAATLLPEARIGNPWSSNAGYAGFAPDLEQRVATARNAIAPLPMRIAERLDSDGDAIRQVLGSGGRLYYRQGQQALGIKQEGTAELKTPTDAQRLVFAIVGSAQQNAVGRPWFKGGPYYMAYPHPPLYLEQDGNTYPFHPDPSDTSDIAVFSTDLGPWDDATAASGFAAYRDMVTDGPATWSIESSRSAAKRYLALALWYAVRQGVPSSFIDGTAGPAEVAAHAHNPGIARGLNALAHAALTLTRWYARTGPAGDNLGTGVAVPGVLSVDATPAHPTLQAVFDEVFAAHPALHSGSALVAPVAGDLLVTQDRILFWHERMLEVVMRHVTHHDDNWALPRPLNRSLATDFPLIQYDTINSTGLLSTSAIPGTASDPNIPPVPAQQWKILTAEAISNPGGNMFNDTLDLATISGDRRHYSLTAPFAPRERCRQLVFWAVDWMSYEDCELAPSAPVDASRYPLNNMDVVEVARFRWLSGTPSYTVDGAMGSQKMNRYSSTGVRFYDRHQALYRNPEKFWAFFADVSALDSGSNVHGWSIGPDGEHHSWIDDVSRFANRLDAYSKGIRGGARADTGWALTPDSWHSWTTSSIHHDPKAAFSGLYGVDRNANHLLDRGHLPPSVRLHAIEVARINIYDPRLEISLR
ncbi:MAG: hypothetical protein PF961_03150 [Planctomycetota bacterium]|jgi:Tfp pilus assembly protein PilV|nr:hypothetical protein [Planctomycetota bacterium]